MTNPIQIITRGDRMIAQFPWSVATKDLVKAAGFRFDPVAKCWYTRDPEVAAKLRVNDIQTAIDAVTAARAEANRKAEASIAASSATDAAIDIPVPDGLAYLPFQRAGIAYAIDRPNVLIGDEMGCGKTVEAAGIINADSTLHKILVICKASIKINWQRELMKWLVRPATVSIANSEFLPTDIVIVNYEQLAKWRAEIDTREWDALIVDECHFVKNPQALRTRLTLGYRPSPQQAAKGQKPIAPIRARRRIFLSGTPFVSKPIELWPLLQSIDPQGLGRSWLNYVTRYCNGRKTQTYTGGPLVWDVTGSSHLDELQTKLRASVMVRRLKKDVLTELPPKQRQILVLAPDASARRAIAAEIETYERHEAVITQLRAAVEVAQASDQREDYELAAQRLQKAERVAFTEVSRVRHDTAVAKVPAVIDHLEYLIEDTDKAVLMAHHHDVIDAIAAKFGASAVVLTGNTPQKDRQAAIDRFQTDPSCKLFIGSITAAGVGITLTASSTVVFAELDWTPGNVSQAEDRCHRVGQRDSVLVQHLVLNGSLDQRMATVLIEKQKVLDAALDDEVAPAQIKPRPESKPPVALPPPQESPPEAAPAQAAPAQAQAAELIPLQPDTVAAIHTGLKMLAGMCDGARSLDGAGFARIDTEIGHSLAGRTWLSPKQAAIGQRLINKYRRQLPTELVIVATRKD